jgi:hypothetical protein
MAKAIFDMGPRHCDQNNVARAVGYSNARNGAFTALKATAVQFGLIVTNGEYLSVTDAWIEVFNSEDAELLQKARRDAMYQPALYKQLLNDFANKQLPPIERLTRELYLNQKYGILKEAANVAAQTFIESASSASMLDAKGFLITGKAGGQQQETPTPTISMDEGIEQAPNQQSHAKTNTNMPQNISTQALLNSDDLDRIEIQLRNGKKAYLLIPVPLPYGEKVRLKGYIDLLLEENPPSQNAPQSEQF